MTEDSARRLLLAAESAMYRAYAPYSRYRVGAALMTADGHVYEGCNIENASYPACLCAERAACAAAVADGHRVFVALALVAGPMDAATEAGADETVDIGTANTMDGGANGPVPAGGMAAVNTWAQSGGEYTESLHACPGMDAGKLCACPDAADCGEEHGTAPGTPTDKAGTALGMQGNGCRAVLDARDGENNADPDAGIDERLSTARTDSDTSSPQLSGSAGPGVDGATPDLTAQSAAALDNAGKIVREADKLPTPCGICRQVLSEFAKADMPIYCAAPGLHAVAAYTLGELLPHAFTLPSSGAAKEYY